ncbi:ABC-2 family transporter protein [Candidatus Roizmanbacteria bacterium]|nr:ABC-2 family transporter protein [Candidatus Roizmanbacteria bacterium]
MNNIFKTCKRYLRVYLVFLRLNFNTLFAYRANLINSLVANSVWAIFGIVAMLLLTSKVSHVFGWTRNELLILAGVYNIIFSIFYLFFSGNFSEFSSNIHFGRLDAILTKPIDSQFMMTCTTVRYTQIVRLILGFSFVIYIISQMHAQITFVIIISFVIYLILSIVILYSLWMMVMTLTIWYTKLSNLVDFLYESHNVAKYPQEIYQGLNFVTYMVIFPLTLIVTIPVKALLQKMLLGDVFWPIIFAIILFYVSRNFWRFALRSYTSASG